MHTDSVQSRIYTIHLKLYITVQYIVQTTSVYSNVWVGEGLHSVWNMLPTTLVYKVHCQLYTTLHKFAKMQCNVQLPKKKSSQSVWLVASISRKTKKTRLSKGGRNITYQVQSNPMDFFKRLLQVFIYRLSVPRGCCFTNNSVADLSSSINLN